MKRKTSFTPSAWDDYIYWQSQDKKTLKRINNLIKECQRTPFEGIGKPEALLGDLSGFWSRTIDEQHTLDYATTDAEITIIAWRNHYE